MAGGAGNDSFLSTDARSEIFDLRFNSLQSTSTGLVEVSSSYPSTSSGTYYGGGSASVTVIGTIAAAGTLTIGGSGSSTYGGGAGSITTSVAYDVVQSDARAYVLSRVVPAGTVLHLGTFRLDGGTSGLRFNPYALVTTGSVTLTTQNSEVVLGLLTYDSATQLYTLTRPPDMNATPIGSILTSDGILVPIAGP